MIGFSGVARSYAFPFDFIFVLSDNLALLLGGRPLQGRADAVER
jgi:hypothetical protein